MTSHPRSRSPISGISDDSEDDRRMTKILANDWHTQREATDSGSLYPVTIGRRSTPGVEFLSFCQAHQTLLSVKFGRVGRHFPDTLRPAYAAVAAVLPQYAGLRVVRQVRVQNFPPYALPQSSISYRKQHLDSLI